MSPSRPPLFDFRTAGLKQARAELMAGDRFLARQAEDGLAERIAAATRRFSSGLMIGDPVPAAIAPLAENWAQTDFDRNEILHAAGGHDLAVSIFSLQAINDLPGALVQIHRMLKPDGLFVAAILGGTTLTELRQSFAQGEIETTGGLSPRVSPFADIRELGGLLQRAGFALPVADVERTQVRYGDISRLVHDLRLHGLTNSLSERRKTFLRRDTLAAALAHYRSHHAQEGRLNASFEIVYLTGWTPHESQQQPLKPGSATARLADILGTVERKI
jgi:hypothetical protein